MDSIEGKRTRLMELVYGMDAGRVRAHPRPGKWSVQEIIEHLVISETGVFGNLDALDGRTPRRRGARDYLLYPLVMFILRFDIPVRVPSPSMIPRGELSLRELGGRWEANHGRLRKWIETSDPAHLERPLFVHPIAGPMTTTQSMRMLEVHLDRHIRQIQVLAQLTLRGSRDP